MRDYFYPALSSVLGSECIPTFVRMQILRALGLEVGEGTYIWSKCSLRSRKISLGKNVFINVGFFFDGASELVIEDNVKIGQFVRVITASHNIGPSWERCLPEPVTGSVRIERGCWIGSGATIMPNVVIRRGCVVGASSLVLTGTEPDGLYVGVPAKRIKDLAPDPGGGPWTRITGISEPLRAFLPNPDACQEVG
jgi:maltose O-acetyltransferase